MGPRKAIIIWIKRWFRYLIIKAGLVKGNLPDFLIIGAMKSGTTSLNYYLSQHPDLAPSLNKEVHFFDGGIHPNVDTYAKGEAWYRAHFPLRRSGSKQKLFEASPLYIFNPLAPGRISRLLPNAKLIAILRDPVERAISHYFHEQGRKREMVPMLEAFRLEEGRLQPVLDRHDYKHKTFIHASYKKRGLYYDQLARYYEYFPKKNILVISNEALAYQPMETLRQVYQFLGIEDGFTVKDLSAKNARSRLAQADHEAYDYLKEYFRKPNQQLFELLGKKFDWM